MSSGVLQEIKRFNAGRNERLVQLKIQKMRVSAFAFFRGTDHLFASHWNDLRLSLPGPPVLSCGDLHLENFGVYRTIDGDFRYEVNDFDEAALLPCGFDLVRFTASLLLAGEEWKLTPLQTSRICLRYLDAYSRTVTDAVRDSRAGEIGPGSGHGAVEELLDKVARASPREFLDEFTEKIKGDRRIIRDPEKRPAVDDAEAKRVHKAVEAFGEQIGKAAAFQVQDVCGRIAGIGSLGVPRYLVLVKGEGTNDRCRLLDVKAVLPSAVAASGPSPQPAWKDEADRVIGSQKRLQSRPPALLAPLVIDSQLYRIREMIPEENRAKIDRFQKKPEKLLNAVQTAARLTAWMHYRGSEPTVHGLLADWTAGSGIDAVLAAAHRIADETDRQHTEFVAELQR